MYEFNFTFTFHFFLLIDSYFLVKRLRHDKTNNEDIDIMSETSNSSLLGKRSFDDATDTQESDDEDVPFSRTM